MRSHRTPPVNGTVGEAIAAGFLEQRGYRILERNYRCPRGEIDLVAWDDVTLVFVEVKARRRTTLPGALDSINRRKQRRMFYAAEHFLATRGLSPRETRFDVVVVLGEGEDVRCELVRDAFHAFR